MRSSSSRKLTLLCLCLIGDSCEFVDCGIYTLCDVTSEHEPNKMDLQ